MVAQTPAGVNQFPFTWSNVATGVYSLTAVAKDNYNATTTSAPVTVRVNTPPSLTITSPSNGAQFAAPANITLNATASDSDGTIASVFFSANGYSVGRQSIQLVMVQRAVRFVCNQRRCDRQ